MTAHIVSTEEVCLRGREPFVVATLDARHYSFIAADKVLPRPSCRPHKERAILRVRVVRPDGSVVEPVASLAFVGGKEPPAKITIFGVPEALLPAGSQIELLRYEKERA